MGNFIYYLQIILNYGTINKIIISSFLWTYLFLLELFLL